VFYKVLLGVAYLRHTQYVRNPTAALTTHTLPVQGFLRKKCENLSNLSKPKYWTLPDFRNLKT